jgi:hypothetical protein
VAVPQYLAVLFDEGWYRVLRINLKQSNDLRKLTNDDRDCVKWLERDLLRKVLTLWLP